MGHQTRHGCRPEYRGLSGRSGYVLDTNVVSALRRVRADKHVLSFLGTCESSSLFVSSLTMGELRKGIEMKRRTDSASAAQLVFWADALETSCATNILPVDARVAQRWGELSADRVRPVVDTLIAATAMVHGLTFVTRNVGDMHGIQVRLVDPWREDPSGNPD